MSKKPELPENSPVWFLSKPGGAAYAATTSGEPFLWDGCWVVDLWELPFSYAVSGHNRGRTETGIAVSRLYPRDSRDNRDQIPWAEILGGLMPQIDPEVLRRFLKHGLSDIHTYDDLLVEEQPLISRQDFGTLRAWLDKETEDA